MAYCGLPLVQLLHLADKARMNRSGAECSSPLWKYPKYLGLIVGSKELGFCWFIHQLLPKIGNLQEL